MQVYLDHHASAPLDPRVAKTMEPYHSIHYGNPASPHYMGSQAQEALTKAREQVARLINADPQHIFFTSGATASNNIVLKGLLFNRIANDKKDGTPLLITTNSEHSSIEQCVQNKYFSKHTCVYYLCIDRSGNIDYSQLNNILQRPLSDTKWVSIISANHEIGTIHDLKRIGMLCRSANAFFHTDATQAIGKVEIDVEDFCIDALSLSAHKIYGPKGVGVLYVRNPDLIMPLIDGGYQEVITSGTVNVPGAVGLGKACEILSEEMHDEIIKLNHLRDKLLLDLTTRIDGVEINGTMLNRLPNNLNLIIDKVPSEVLIRGMTDVIVSGGSACTSGEIEPSNILKVLGAKNPEYAIRIGVGRFNTEEQIDYAVERIVDLVEAVRGADSK